MGDVKKTPALRFAGFSGEWEERKLGEEATEMVAGGDVNRELLIEEGKYPVIANALTNEGVVGYYEDGYRIKAPAVTVTGRGDVGHAKARNTNFTPIVRLLAIKSNHNVYFLENGINTLRIVVESTGVPQLTVPQLAKYELAFPPTVDEEIAIGTFFRDLDTLITLHQRKYDVFVNVKKSMLEKMFPKEGARVPEVRFAGFTGDWEERKLGNIVDFLDTQRKPLEEAKRKKGKYPYYGASGIVDYVEGYLFDEELVLLSEDGANITDRNYPVCFLASGRYWVNNHAHVLKSNYGYENNFICNSLERKDFGRYNTGMAMPKLNQETCKNISIFCPRFEEQALIGTFFRNLDTLITLHQRKLTLLKNLKKACLEKMFV